MWKTRQRFFTITLETNGVFIATDINLPPDYRFNFLEHFITILPTAYTLQHDKRLCTH